MLILLQKIFLILYPLLENSTTRIAIVTTYVCNIKQKLYVQILTPYYSTHWQIETIVCSLCIVYLVGVVILYLSFFNVHFKCFRFCCILVVVLFLTSKTSIQDALSARLKWSHCGDCGSQLNLDPLVMWHFCKGVINYHQLYCLGVTKAPTVDYCCPAIWCVVFAFYLP